MAGSHAGRNCCCHWGAAVSGEYPEFPCYYCERHDDRFIAAPEDTCKRHKEPRNRRYGDGPPVTVSQEFLDRAAARPSSIGRTPMTNPNKTLVVGLLDRTGSIQTIKSDVEGGWNAMIETIRNEDAGDEVFVTLFQFDRNPDDRTHEVLEVVYEDCPINDVRPLQLHPRGMTPLHDAIGLSISRIGGSLAKLDESDRPGKVIFVIMTDGLENASKEYTLPRVKELVKEHRETWKWEFNFMGVGIDAYSVGSDYGFDRGSTQSVVNSGPAVRASYGVTGMTVNTSRRAGPNLKKVTDEDRS